MISFYRVEHEKQSLRREWVNKMDKSLSLRKLYKHISFGYSDCNSISGKFSIKENYFGFNKNILSAKNGMRRYKDNRDEGCKNK